MSVQRHGRSANFQNSQHGRILETNRSIPDLQGQMSGSYVVLTRAQCLSSGPPTSCISIAGSWIYTKCHPIPLKYGFESCRYLVHFKICELSRLQSLHSFLSESACAHSTWPMSTLTCDELINLSLLNILLTFFSRKLPASIPVAPE